jgi:uncharacterized protein YrzB (UPF0473 family)
MEKLEFTADDGSVVNFYVEAQTRVNGMDYLLVSDKDEDDETDEAEAYILKDISEDSSEEAQYVFVEDDREIEALLKVFSEMLDDTDIER